MKVNSVWKGESRKDYPEEGLFCAESWNTHTQNQSKLNNSLITASQYHSPGRLRKNSQKSIDPWVLFFPSNLLLLKSFLNIWPRTWKQTFEQEEVMPLNDCGYQRCSVWSAADADPGFPAGGCFISGTACHPFRSHASSFEPPQVCWSHWVVPCSGEASLQGWKPGEEWEEAWVLAGLLSSSASAAGLETHVSGLLSPSWKPPAPDTLSARG